MSLISRRREKGFTLIEMLTVLAVISIIAAIATVSVSRTLKKQRVEAAGNQLQSFIESAAVHARERSNGVFVWIHRDNAPGGAAEQWWYCYLIEDANGDDILDYVITQPNNTPPGNPANADRYITTQIVNFPADIVIAAQNGATTSAPPNLPNQWPGPNNWPMVGNDFLLLCDPRGLPFNPTLAAIRQINNPVAISLTHQEMTTGELAPGIRYDITISPLWHTRLDTVLY